MVLTKDLIQTHRHYRAIYWNWPTELILAHIMTIDEKVDKMKADDMLEVRALMDNKIPLWR